MQAAAIAPELASTTPESDDWLRATVCEAMRLTPDTLFLRLVSASSQSLPYYEPGAHIAVRCGDETRHYSLMGSGEHPGLYDLGIKLTPDSRGGSRWLFEHATVGARLSISAPRNHFELTDQAPAYLLLGGGIGITPLLSMLYALRRRGQRARLVYLCAQRAGMAFEPWLSELAEFHDIHMHCDDEAGLYDLAAELDRAAPDTAVYCCGPAGMMEAVRRHGEDSGRAEHYHFEHFSPPAPAQEALEAGEFMVVQASTGRSIKVGKTKTMLAALREAGLTMKSECEYGVCGWCAVGVLEGQPEHFDSYLTSAEKEANKLVLPCVSRCASPSITLDI